MLIELLPEPKTYPYTMGPRCTKRVRSTGTDFYGRDPHKCARAARFKVNGRKYCTQHAGELALKHLLKEQEQLKQDPDIPKEQAL